MDLSGNNLLKVALDAIFPRFCVECQAEGALLCSPCVLNWQHQPPVTDSGHVALFAYANPAVRKLICAWKYDYDLSAFKLLTTQASQLLPEFVEQIQALGVQAIAPLPLSGRRLRERGFNQSRMLADWLSKELNLPVVEVLERMHKQGHQADRTHEERELAMKDSPFSVINARSLPPVILLVDDVWTTGATLLAAKDVLESTNKTQVFAFTLAKG